MKGKKTGKKIPKVAKKSRLRDLAAPRGKAANVRGGVRSVRRIDDDDPLAP